MKLWIVGQYRSGSIPNVVWDFQGVFDSEEKAVAACVDKNYFIGPIGLNEAVPSEASAWPGSRHPLE